LLSPFFFHPLFIGPLVDCFLLFFTRVGLPPDFCDAPFRATGYLFPYGWFLVFSPCLLHGSQVFLLGGCPPLYPEHRQAHADLLFLFSDTGSSGPLFPTHPRGCPPNPSTAKLQESFLLFFAGGLPSCPALVFLPPHSPSSSKTPPCRTLYFAGSLASHWPQSPPYSCPHHLRSHGFSSPLAPFVIFCRRGWPRGPLLNFFNTRQNLLHRGHTLPPICPPLGFPPAPSPAPLYRKRCWPFSLPGAPINDPPGDWECLRGFARVPFAKFFAYFAQLAQNPPRYFPGFNPLPSDCLSTRS